ncbi:hypothetical protein E2562_008199 [Oryza meyeriana var. granulata]|uniref:Uncharacterized protein n=1 Tax=Oryza meyeriana var. granulata TaxID=110450 RepID=A0A6G1CEN2_9ORYZ|nr:hypothetical protein E2562_008199 [Oryza meyeriana var. granulata]
MELPIEEGRSSTTRESRRPAVTSMLSLLLTPLTAAITPASTLRAAPGDGSWASGEPASDQAVVVASFARRRRHPSTRLPHCHSPTRSTSCRRFPACDLTRSAAPQLSSARDFSVTPP